MRKSKYLIVIIVVVVLAVLAMFLIERETDPSPNSRVVLEYTYRSYIAPACFEESNPTNFLDEGTLAEAKELGFKPHSKCTEEAFAVTKDPLIISLLKEMGMIESQ